MGHFTLKTVCFCGATGISSSSSFAEEKKDCSTIDTSTGVGMLEKYKCKKDSGGELELGKKIKNFFKSRSYWKS